MWDSTNGLLITDPYRHKGVIDSLVKDDEGKPTGRYMVTTFPNPYYDRRDRLTEKCVSRSRKTTCETGCRLWTSGLSTGLWKKRRRNRLKKFGINTRRGRSRGIWNRKSKAWNEWSFDCRASVDRDSIFNRTYEIGLFQKRELLGLRC